MADEVQKIAQDGVPQADEVVLISDVPQAEKPPASVAVAKEPPLVPESDEEPVKPKRVDEALKTEISKPNGDDQEKVPLSGSFKEESTRVADLLENEKKALEELRQLVQEALNKHRFGMVAMPQQPETAK